MQTASLGALEFEVFAPSTGYLAFATVTFYIFGLYLISPRVDRAEELLYNIFIERHQLTPAVRRRLIAAVAQTTAQDQEVIEAELVEEKEI
jgi:hypothetical protein